MRRIADFLRAHRWQFLGTVALLAALAVAEWWIGRLPFGPEGSFGWWSGDIDSIANSQRVADVYSFTHVVHGVIIYAGLWLVARKAPARYRFLAAVAIEVGWELLENSPMVIDRYRAATIARGYVGDSILNSVADVGMMGIGFLIAHSLKAWKTAVFVLVLELGCMFLVRDNLTLNVLMLAHPVESVREWQSARPR